MNKPQLKNIFFDLDGTLTNPREGIVNCYQYAFAKLGLPELDRDLIASHIGPELRLVLHNLLNTDELCLVERAVGYYRERFATVGFCENVVYEGIPEMLEGCGNKYRLFVVTFKPTVFAKKVLRHFALDHHFAEILGPEIGRGTPHKSELLKALLVEHNCLRSESIIVGDRSDDVEAGLRNNVMPLAVTYGFGSTEELRSAGARTFCSSPAELVSHFENY